MSLRQISRYFDLIMTRKIEEWKYTAALHGVKLDGNNTPQRTGGKGKIDSGYQTEDRGEATQSLDTRNLSPEQWKRMAGRMNQQQNYGAKIPELKKKIERKAKRKKV